MKSRTGVLVCLALLLLVSCGEQASSVTDVALAPSVTPLPPTGTPVPPTVTPVPPTDTPLPPTPTSAPPTATPTPTPLPPTATRLPPTPTQAPSATPVGTIQAGDYERQVVADGRERSYLLHVPPGWTSQEPVPVVFAFHGYTQMARILQSNSGLDDIADVANFLVVYPEGVERSWNTGGASPGLATALGVDEPAFVRQMLADLGTVASIDPKRIYAAGMSQGGILSYRLACEMSDILAAIAPVAAFRPSFPACQPQQAVSVIHVHGLADAELPYAGGGPWNNPPIEAGITFWADFDGCTGSPVVEELSNGVTHTAYAPCEAGTAVELYTIDSGYHFWPSEDVFPAAQVIWDFFAAHPQP